MKYKLTGRVTVSAYTEVEADSEEEALECASGRMAYLEGYAEADNDWIVGDVDGEIEDIKIESREFGRRQL